MFKKFLLRPTFSSRKGRSPVFLMWPKGMKLSIITVVTSNSVNQLSYPSCRSQLQTDVEDGVIEVTISELCSGRRVMNICWSLHEMMSSSSLMTCGRYESSLSQKYIFRSLVAPVPAAMTGDCRLGEGGGHSSES